MAVTPTNNFVVVWQERNDDVCQDANPGDGEPELNGTSAIFFADKSSTNWTTQLGQLDNDRTTYSIDPDIVVQGSTRHIIYMKYTGGNPNDCAGGGGASQYNIYYRGPFVTVQSPGTPGTYSISGRVTDSNGNPISGVTISAGGGRTTTTDGTGIYTLGGLAADNYTLAPSKNGYTFSPALRTINLPPNSIERNFIGAPLTPPPPGNPPLVIVHGIQLFSIGGYSCSDDIKEYGQDWQYPWGYTHLVYTGL